MKTLKVFSSVCIILCNIGKIILLYLCVYLWILTDQICYTYSQHIKIWMEGFIVEPDFRIIFKTLLGRELEDQNVPAEIYIFVYSIWKTLSCLFSLLFPPCQNVRFFPADCFSPQSVSRRLFKWMFGFNSRAFHVIFLIRRMKRDCFWLRILISLRQLSLQHRLTFFQPLSGRRTK